MRHEAHMQYSGRLSLCTHVHATGHTRTKTNTKRWPMLCAFFVLFFTLQAADLIKMVLVKWTYGYQMSLCPPSLTSLTFLLVKKQTQAHT